MGAPNSTFYASISYEAPAPTCRGRPQSPTGYGVIDTPLELARQLIDIRTAFLVAATKYVANAIARRLGEDFRTAVEGLLFGLLVALGIMITTTLVGTGTGAAIGSLGFGAGAGPGAALGARIGAMVGEWILSYLGVMFLLTYLFENLGQLSDHFLRGLQLAWNSHGNPCQIDMAARQFAEGVAVFFSLLVQAIIVYVTREAHNGRFNTAMQNLRNSKLFAKAARLEAWLGNNYAAFRAKYLKLDWERLDESRARIGTTSIPESMMLRVGGRKFSIARNKGKVGPDGKAIDPATKHMAERAQGANPWAAAAEVDFPTSSLAGALDQAEAQLLFKPRGEYRNLKIGDWELSIDTRDEVWRVFHAVYRGERL